MEPSQIDNIRKFFYALEDTDNKILLEGDGEALSCKVINGKGEEQGCILSAAEINFCIGEGFLVRSDRGKMDYPEYIGIENVELRLYDFSIKENVGVQAPNNEIV